ncbi:MULTISPECIES: response regulator transcription factor [Olivibacter]|uniref:Response regulator transcription factor n=1 Tax=Olivibacter jilunii TaxID=985016 RepID=A0ABW6AWT7_9SPHI
MIKTLEIPHFPAGLVCNKVEIFANGDEPHCLTGGQTYSFEDFSDRTKEILQESLDNSDDDVHEGLTLMGKIDQEDRLKQFTYCMFGGFDHFHDIDENGKLGDIEYFDCGKRGNCPGEFLVCKLPQTDNGSLTKSETQVLKLIRYGKTVKEIAYETHTSELTIKTHIQNIKKKVGYGRMAELAVFAFAKQLN